MSVRQPFEVPADCEGKWDISFDINILPSGFPLCSLPDFVEPDTKHFIPPIITPPVFPPNCVCFPTIEATANTRVGPRKLDVKLIQTNEDCCEPEIKLSMDFDMPDLIVGGALTRLGKHPEDLRANMAYEDQGSHIKLSYDINIPCICFPSITTPPDIQKEHVNFPMDLAIDDAKLNIRITQVNTDCCEPEVKVSFDLDLPCFPVTVKVTSTQEIETPQVDKAVLDIKLTREDDCEGIKLSYNFQMPCFPKALEVAQEASEGYSYQGEPKLEIKLTKLDDCEGIKLSYNFQMPCLPKEMTADATVVLTEDPDDEPEVEVEITDQGDCKFEYKFNFGFPPARPCLEFSMPKLSGATIEAEWIEFDELPESLITFGAKVELCSGMQNELKLPIGVKLKLPGGLDDEIDIVTDVKWVDGCMIKEVTTYKIVQGRIAEPISVTEVDIVCGEECPT